MLVQRKRIHGIKELIFGGSLEDRGGSEINNGHYLASLLLVVNERS